MRATFKIMSENMYEVEKILGKRFKLGNPEYLIKWKGYNRSEATWEPYFSLTTIQPMITLYEQERQKNDQSNRLSKKSTKKIKNGTINKNLIRPSDLSNSNADQDMSAQDGEIGLDSSPRQKRVNLYMVKLNEKLKKNQKYGTLQTKLQYPIEKTAQQTAQPPNQDNEENVEILKIAYVAAKNKRMIQLRVNNSILLKELDQVRNLYPRALCQFYQKIFKLIL